MRALTCTPREYHQGQQYHRHTRRPRNQGRHLPRSHHQQGNHLPLPSQQGMGGLKSHLSQTHRGCPHLSNQQEMGDQGRQGGKRMSHPLSTRSMSWVFPTRTPGPMRDAPLGHPHHGQGPEAGETGHTRQTKGRNPEPHCQAA